MKIKKVKTNYQRLKMDELHTLAGKVVACMKDSNVFTDLPIDIEDLENIAQDFQRTWETAKDGGSKLDRSHRDEARTILLEAFSRLAIYVNQTARGQLSVLLSSGFELEAEQKPTKITEPPQRVKLKDGPQKNQLALQFQAVADSLFYEYEYADDLDDEGMPIWNEPLQTGSSSLNIIAPTQAGLTYYARVRTRNTAGASDWSDTVSLMAR